jgi:hypothetical protein
MRADMSEVIIERPRINSRSRYPRDVRRREASTARLDPESLPFGAGMKRASVGRNDEKLLNENLVPLRRYLERQVNRPWDKIWSEIAAKLKPDSTVQQHVRDHIRDFVAAKTFVKDGVVWVVEGRRFYGGPYPLSRSDVKLYVDPRTGLLRRNKYAKTDGQRQAANARERAQRMREIAPNVQVHHFGKRGWWEAVLTPTAHFPHDFKWEGLDVVLKSGLSELYPDVLYGRAGVYAIAKRQLSKREVARLHMQRSR